LPPLDSLPANRNRERVHHLQRPDGGDVQSIETGRASQQLFGFGGGFVFAAPRHAYRNIDDEPGH
jgi:hypothetical protein